MNDRDERTDWDKLHFDWSSTLSSIDGLWHRKRFTLLRTNLPQVSREDWRFSVLLPTNAEISRKSRSTWDRVFDDAMWHWMMKLKINRWRCNVCWKPRGRKEDVQILDEPKIPGISRGSLSISTKTVKMSTAQSQNEANQVQNASEQPKRVWTSLCYQQNRQYKLTMIQLWSPTQTISPDCWPSTTHWKRLAANTVSHWSWHSELMLTVAALVALWTDSFPEEGRKALEIRGILARRIEYLLPSVSKDVSIDLS